MQEDWKKIAVEVSKFIYGVKNGYSKRLAARGYKIAENIEQKIEVEELKITGSFILPFYWKYIEHGRRAGSRMPPVNVIERWIVYRNIKPINPKMNTRSLAFVISRAIAQRGIKMKPDLNESYFEKMQNINEFLDNIKNIYITGLFSTLKK